MAEGTTKRINKVPVFGSSNLRKPWYLRWTPESLHPFLKGLFRKNPNEWSDRENEKFMEAMTLAKKLKGVEDRMGLLNPDLDEEIDDISVGDPEGLLAYKGDDYKGTSGPRWVDRDWSPEVISPGIKDEEGDSALDVIALDDKRREDKLFAGLLASEDYMGTLGEDVYVGLSRDKYSDPEDTTLEMLTDETRWEKEPINPSYLENQYAQYRRSDSPVDGGFAASQESGGKSKGLTPMQKYGAKLITDIFAEKEERPRQSIGASPLIPGRALDMSKYVSSRRPKRDRYRNLGLLARGTV